jgi:hypothetical protein
MAADSTLAEAAAVFDGGGGWPSRIFQPPSITVSLPSTLLHFTLGPCRTPLRHFALPEGLQTINISESYSEQKNSGIDVLPTRLLASLTRVDLGDGFDGFRGKVLPMLPACLTDLKLGGYSGPLSEVRPLAAL